MILLTSLLYCVIMYVVPGVLLTDWIARLLNGGWGAPAIVWFLALHATVYGLILLVVKFGRLACKDFDLGEHRYLRATRDWLRGGSSAWLGMAGFLLIGGGTGWMTVNGLFPVQLIPLIAATLVGLWSIQRKPLRLDGLLAFPETRYEPSQEPAPSGPDYLEKEIAWTFAVDGSADRTETFSEQFSVRAETYAKIRAQKRFPARPLSEYLRYIAEQRTPDLKAAANQIRFLSIGKGFTSIQEVENVVALVRSIPYETDEKTHNVSEYANFPLETLVELLGDCEDHGILAAALLYELGHRVGLFWLDLGESGHIALAYHSPDIRAGFGGVGSDGLWYHYVETVPCDTNERVGDLSLEFRTRLTEAKVVVFS